MPAAIENSTKVCRREVMSLDEVKVGDHVAFDRPYVIWHHAIVVDVKPRDRKMTVVHYTGATNEGRKASVLEQELEVDLKKTGMYAFDYVGCPFDPAQVVERARSRLKESKYHMTKLNCEHFAHWCKTGLDYSDQVKAFLLRIRKTGVIALIRGILEGAVIPTRVLLKRDSVKKILRIASKRLDPSVGRRGVRAFAERGALTVDVILNYAIEAGVFFYSALKSYQKYKSNEISKKQFLRELCQTGSECTGGFVGAVGGGLLGQLLIPIPFLGGIIGSVTGSLVSRFVGSMAGKAIAKRAWK